MSIQNELNQIKNAVYGKDVRQSIHDGIKKAYDDATLSGNTNMEVSLARGTHSTLNNRLNSIDDKQQQTTAQLAQKARKSEVRENTDDRPINVSEMDTETKQLFTGGSVAVVGPDSVGPENIKRYAVLEDKIKSRAINHSHTNFLKIGKNKALPTPTKDFFVGLSGRVTDTNAEEIYPDTFRSFVSYIEPNTAYRITKFEGGDRFRVAILDGYPSSLPYESLELLVGDEDNPEEQYLDYFNEIGRVAIITTNYEDLNVPRVQVEEGYQTTEYEPFQTSLYDTPIQDSVDSVSNIIGRGKNLFDGNFTKNVFVGLNNTVGYRVEGNLTSAITLIGGGDKITVSKNNVGDRFRIGVVPIIPTPENSEVESRYFYRDDTAGAKEHTFINPTAEPAFLVVQTNTEDDRLPLVQVEKGDSATEYEEYELKLFGKEFQTPTSQTVESANKYFFLDSLSDIYNPPFLESVASGEPFDLEQSTHDDIYDIFADLYNDDENYITKGVIGNDTGGKPINYYHLKPEEVMSDIRHKRPKIIMFSGLHGDEKLTVWGLTQYVKQLCEEWRTDKTLEFVRWNVELIVVPVANPSGYDLNQRQNLNNVDLNRNFPQYWEPREEGLNYSGTEPASEIETQLLMYFIQQHDDVEILIDCHNFHQRESRVLWSPASRTETKLLAMNTINTLARKWREEYDFIPKDEQFGYVNNVHAATMYHWADSIGINTILVETARRINYAPDAKFFDGYSSTLTLDFIGNTIVAICKNL